MDWLNDPALQNMDPIKKELFRHAASQIEGKQGNAMASALMGLIMSANKRGVSFTKEEISAILKIMKQGKTPQEQAQIDNMVRMVSNMTPKHKR